MGSMLFVEGQPPSFSTQQLMDLFAPFGTVLSALVFKDPAGKSLRTGKVEMSTPREAERAMQKLHRSLVQGELLLVFKDVEQGGSTGQKKKEPHRLIEIMEEPNNADHSVTVAIVALSAIVFVLDVVTPTGIAIWALYVLPLGFTRWSSVEHLVFIVAGACTALIILGYVYSPPGASVEVVIMNRMLGVLMVWITAYFLRPERM